MTQVETVVFYQKKGGKERETVVNHFSEMMGLGLGPVAKEINAVSVDRTRDLQIFSLTLSQLSYPRLLAKLGQ
jgi:hypothetical protein